MPKAHFEIYRARTFDMAKTMVIKCLAAATTINRELQLMGETVNEADPSTWKYYLNMAGQYHSRDTMMTVASHDTLQTIEFTVANLQLHRATREAYAFGTQWYNELVTRYPDQECLILGILNPVDLTTAIAAKDGEILWYEPSAVEANEENLIQRLQAWVDGIFARWHVSAYQLTDSLYVASFVSMLYNFLPLAIMNIRLSNCHTRFVHSFHIREFLASHGKLHIFIDYLTKAQSLWLYRNIRYIHRNAGKQDTFDWLVENILTARGIPLSEWDMRHDLEHMPDPQLYPKVEFIRSPLNFGRHFTGADLKTIEEMLDDEQPIARGNLRVQEDAEIDIRLQMETSIRNRYKTKVLESAMLDLTDAIPFPFADFILNHWLYLSQTNRYNSFITFDDPRTGASTVLSTKDAFVVMLYAANKQFGLQLTQVPTIQARMVRRIPTPARAEIEAITVASDMRPEILDRYYEILPEVGTHISIAGFRERMRECHTALMQQWFIWTQQEYYHHRGAAEIAGLRFYADTECVLAPDGTSYETWFADRSMPYYDYNELESQILAETILTKATGADLVEEISLAELQDALIRLMARLSSYTVQFLKEINRFPVKILDWNAVRIGQMEESSADHSAIIPIQHLVQNLIVEPNELLHLRIWELGIAETLYESDQSTDEMMIDTYLKPHHAKQVIYRYELPYIGVLNIEEQFNALDTDTPDRDSDDYLPSTYVELSDAFVTLSTPQYSLTNANRITLQQRFDAYLADLTIADPIDVQIPGTVLNGLSTWTQLDSLHALDGFGLD